MARYRDDRRSGTTRSRTEARQNRRLQLIVNNTHAVEPGPTLIQQMEERLDETIHERTRLRQDWEHAEDLSQVEDDPSVEKAYEDVVENAGKIRGMLEMLGIMRSTSAKIELKRARARISHGVKPHSTEQ